MAKEDNSNKWDTKTILLIVFAILILLYLFFQSQTKNVLSSVVEQIGGEEIDYEHISSILQKF
jgi:hypothetical protein